LKYVLAQRCLKVSLHTILIGVIGTIYTCQTELPLSKLGLDCYKVNKRTIDMNTHSIKYATKIIHISRRFENNTDRAHVFFQNLPRHKRPSS